MSNGNGASSRVVLTDNMAPLKSTAQLSSVERSQLLDDIVQQLGEVTEALNALTRHVDILTKNHEALRQYAETLRVSLADDRTTAFARHVSFVTRSFMSRLRWFLTGR